LVGWSVAEVPSVDGFLSHRTAIPLFHPFPTHSPTHPTQTTPTQPNPTHPNQTQSTPTQPTPTQPTEGHINPDVAIEAYTMNITTVDGFDAFKASVTQPNSPDVSRVDLILSCVDNYEARITINQVRVGAAVGGRGM